MWIKGIFYGWWIVVACFILQCLSGGLLFSGFTVYFLPLKDEFGWSRTLLASGFSLNLIWSGILGPPQGWFIDRFGPRWLVTLGVTLFGAGFLVFSQIHSILGFFLAFFLLGIGSSLSGFLPSTATVTNWFTRKRGLAIGIMMCGLSMGGLIVPILAWSVTGNGWRATAFASGLLIWSVGIPAALMLRHKPEQYGYLPDGGRTPLGIVAQKSQGSPFPTTQTRMAPYKHSFTAKEALRTSAFWLISLGHASAVFGVGAIFIHLIPHIVQRTGVSLEVAGSVVAFMLIMSLIGQIAGGYLGDKIDKRALLVGCMVGHAIALLILAYATNFSHLILFGILNGLAWGGRGPTQSALRADYFGTGHYATIIGFSSMLVMLGMVCGPIFAGTLADWRGSYTMPFTILAIITGLGSLFFVFARRPNPK